MAMAEAMNNGNGGAASGAGRGPVLPLAGPPNLVLPLESVQCWWWITGASGASARLVSGVRSEGPLALTVLLAFAASGSPLDLGLGSGQASRLTLVNFVLAGSNHLLPVARYITTQIIILSTLICLLATVVHPQHRAVHDICAISLGFCCCYLLIEITL